jgi:hypothetical protein
MAIETKKAHVVFTGKYVIKVTNPYYSRTFELPRQTVFIDLISIKKLNTSEASDAAFVLKMEYSKEYDCHYGSASFLQNDGKLIECLEIVTYNNRRETAYEAKIEC